MAALGNGADCGICLQPLARLVEPVPRTEGSRLAVAMRSTLDGCAHMFCYGCISR